MSAVVRLASLFSGDFKAAPPMLERYTVGNYADWTIMMPEMNPGKP